MSTIDDPEFLMAAALDEARLAYEKGEVPIGCVVSQQGTIIAKAHNLVEISQSVTAHAEILAMNSASKALENWRLTGCTLCVTLEPCLMCLGAIKLARIDRVIFGAGDSRQGALGSAFNLSGDVSIGPALTVISGIRKEDSVALLKRFFAERRKKEG